MPRIKQNRQSTVNKETAAARQAFEDYWDLGPARSIRNLHLYYLNRRTDDPEVPTRRLTTLAEWSRSHCWQDRLIERMARDCERAEAMVADERVQWKKQRIQQSRRLHETADRVVKQIIKRLHTGDLEKMPLFGETVTEGTRKFRREGLWDLMPTVLRAIELGHKNERIETGDVPSDTGVQLSAGKALAEILAELPEDVREGVRAELTSAVFAGTDQEGRQ